MKVLGLNGWTERGHDGGASLIIDGKLVFSIEEEKLIGKRHAYDTLPLQSISTCLKYGNLTLEEIDKFIIGWDYEKLYEMLNDKFISKAEMSKELFGSEKYASKIEYLTHHKAHAYSTFYPSNYKNALVLIIDGQGEYIGTSLYLADREKNEMKLLMETPISLGYFYAGITQQIGFRSGEEGKTMGLASYGEAIYLDELRKLISLDENENIRCVFHVDKTSKDEEEASLENWEQLLSKIIPKRNGKIIEITDDIIPYANLAKSGQTILEEIMCGLIKKYIKETGVHDVCIAGGVGLNCPTNSAIENMKEVSRVFVQPAANDGGISLGAAIKGAIDLGDQVNIEMIPYLGPEYSQQAIESALKEKNYDYQVFDNIEIVIAKLLAEGKIVANFQGRLELGPRALGNRSLLASPEKYETLVRMNGLKGREVWRPLAPAVLYDKQSTVFDSNIFSPHMTKNFYVLNDMKNKLEAITHVDGTARIQSVTREYNELFYNIINEFYKLTGIPVVINTSFNVKGEPIVCTPMEAIDSFERMNLDYLSIGNCLIKRKVDNYDKV